MVGDLGKYENSEFNLGELVGSARKILRSIAHHSGDGRVAAIPDERTVRYYQTFGLLKKPIRYDGRVAVYGYHHLLQLLAIKLLQSQGLSLAQIQNALVQLSKKGLEQQLRIAMSSRDQEVSPPVDANNLLSGDPLFLGQLEAHPSRSCQGSDEDWVPIYEKPRTFQGRDLIAAEIVPGISVMIDPKKVKNARKILESIRTILQKSLGDIE